MNKVKRKLDELRRWSLFLDVVDLTMRGGIELSVYFNFDGTPRDLVFEPVPWERGVLLVHLIRAREKPFSIKVKVTPPFAEQPNVLLATADLVENLVEKAETLSADTILELVRKYFPRPASVEVSDTGREIHVCLRAE